MTNKLDYKPNRAIKHPFKIVLLGVFVFLGFLFVNEAVLGGSVFSDNFESYDLGNLNTQGNWFQDYSNVSFKVVDDDSKTGEKSVYADFWGADQSNSAIIGENQPTGDLTYSFKIPSNNRTYYLPINYATINFFELATTSVIKFSIKMDYTPDYVDIYLQEALSPFTKHFIKYNASVDEWHDIIVEWRIFDFKARAKFDDENFSAWFSIGSTWENINKIGLYSWITNYFDDVSICSENNCNLCETYLTCQNASCCWYYSIWLHENFCVNCPTGECGSGPNECQNCLTEVNCEAQELCYWFNGICKFGTGACGEGLELQFCENQTECENANGYWYSNFCWLSPPVALTSWDDYYNQYGDYATPSAWISNMASNTSLFLGQIGGFLSIFEGNFDLMEAYERGKNFGEVIPKARGYLTIFDNFLGGFPIGEFFVFLLIFMIAVGVFRIMRNLFQLIKFW